MLCEETGVNVKRRGYGQCRGERLWSIPSEEAMAGRVKRLWSVLCKEDGVSAT